MTQNEFEAKWHEKKVQIKGYYDSLPDKTYIVTAALLPGVAEDLGVFAIMAEDYNESNKHWFTIKFGWNELYKIQDNFEVITS